METIFSLIFPLVVALVLAVAALYRGADTRPGFDERPDRTRFGPMN